MKVKKEYNEQMDFEVEWQKIKTTKEDAINMKNWKKRWKDIKRDGRYVKPFYH